MVPLARFVSTPLRALSDVKPPPVASTVDGSTTCGTASAPSSRCRMALPDRQARRRSSTYPLLVSGIGRAGVPVYRRGPHFGREVDEVDGRVLHVGIDAEV